MSELSLCDDYAKNAIRKHGSNSYEVALVKLHRITQLDYIMLYEYFLRHHVEKEIETEEEKLWYIIKAPHKNETSDSTHRYIGKRKSDGAYAHVHPCRAEWFIDEDLEQMIIIADSIKSNSEKRSGNLELEKVEVLSIDINFKTKVLYSI